MKFQAVIHSVLLALLYPSGEVKGTPLHTLTLVLATFKNPTGGIEHQRFELKFSNENTIQEFWFAMPAQGSEAKPCEIAFLLTSKVGNRIMAKSEEMIADLRKEIHVRAGQQHHHLKYVEATLETIGKKTTTYKVCVDFTATYEVVHKSHKPFASAFTVKSGQRQFEFSVYKRPANQTFDARKQFTYISFKEILKQN